MSRYLHSLLKPASTSLRRTVGAGLGGVRLGESQCILFFVVVVVKEAPVLCGLFHTKLFSVARHSGKR